MLFKLNSNADICVFKHISAFNPDNLTAFNAGELSFLPCQSHCTWKINLYYIARPNRHCHWHSYIYTAFADIRASTVKKSVSFRQPYTHRPGKIGSVALALLCQCFHNKTPKKLHSHSNDKELIGNVKLERLAYLGKTTKVSYIFLNTKITAYFLHFLSGETENQSSDCLLVDWLHKNRQQNKV